MEDTKARVAYSRRITWKKSSENGRAKAASFPKTLSYINLFFMNKVAFNKGTDKLAVTVAFKRKFLSSIRSFFFRNLTLPLESNHIDME